MVPPPSSAAARPPHEPPLVGLTDAQKKSLARLWTTHSQNLDASNFEGDPALGSTGSDLDDRTYRFITRLYSFLTKCVETHSDAGIGQKQREEEDVKPTIGFVPDREADDGIIGRRAFGSLRHLLRLRQNKIHPRIMAEGRQVVQFDHVLLEEELARHELPRMPQGSKPPPEYVQQFSYGSFLYHLPERALAAMGTAIGLMLSELIRKSLNQGGQQDQQ